MIRKTIHNISELTKNPDVGKAITENKALHIAIVMSNEMSVKKLRVLHEQN